MGDEDGVRALVGDVFRKGGVNMDLNKILGLDGVEMRIRPELPKLKFEKDRTEYSVTDIRYLNESAISAFFAILDEVANNRGIANVTFDISDIGECDIRIISDILMGIEYEARKKGRNGFWVKGSFLVIGYHKTTEEDGRELITYDLSRCTTKIIYDYAQNVRKEQPDNKVTTFKIDELVVAFAKDEVTT